MTLFSPLLLVVISLSSLPNIFSKEVEHNPSSVHINAFPLTDEHKWTVPCSNQYSMDEVQTPGCTPKLGGKCDRVLVDEFINENKISTLLSIAEKGMSMADSKGQKKSILGPTIMDVNSGWVLSAGSYQPQSIYRNGPLFTEKEYDVYRKVSDKLKAHVEHVFGLDSLYFTAPTFITREAADIDNTWTPTTMHDEYWHPHVDKNNTAHYDYSGLVYLSTAGDDFEGGDLHFYSHHSLDCSPFMDETNPGPCIVKDSPIVSIEPRAGRAIVFGSGYENAHRVTRVTGGTRYVLSFWFTCDSRREMKSFLDGKMHVSFDAKAHTAHTDL